MSLLQTMAFRKWCARLACLLLAPSLMVLLSDSPCDAQDWARFRGPGGRGIVEGDSGVPLQWSENENIGWKMALPGPGSSSPIVVGDRVFITCYSGYGIDNDEPGEMEDLKRHLICLNRHDGTVLWEKVIPARMPEDRYSGYIAEHGYASNTPVSDGERVYVFFSKTGVFAFDLAGNRVWHADVGQESGSRRWGSAASLILYDDYVIVNAADESRSIRALDRETGEEIWKAEASSFDSTYGTPALVTTEDGETELVAAVPGEVWGLDPNTGDLLWYATSPSKNNVCPSVLAQDGRIFVSGGFIGTGSAALRPGGEGDVTDSHVDWTSNVYSYVATPILYEGHLYWIDDNGIAHCLNADSGEEVHRVRIQRGSIGFGGGRPFYASPILVDGHLVCPSRRAGTFILRATPELEQVAQNGLEDDSDFNGTAAVSNGQMFLRSNRFLYCIQGDAAGQ